MITLVDAMRLLPSRSSRGRWTGTCRRRHQAARIRMRNRNRHRDDHSNRGPVRSGIVRALADRRNQKPTANVRSRRHLADRLRPP